MSHQSLTGVFGLFILSAVIILVGIAGCGSSASAPSNITYAQTNMVVAVGTAVTTNTPTVTGTVTTWSISPSLPAGLVFSTANGSISGTPTAALPITTYTITATNSGGSTKTTIQITVNGLAAPSGLSYPQTAIVATVGQAIATDTPSVTGTVTTWSVSPALPTGLIFGTGNGAISGTPTAASAQATYTVTATNSGGSTEATVQVTVNAAVVPPSALSYPQTTISGTVGQAIATDTPSVTGSVTSWSVNPAMPAGVTFSTTTGVISGTPSATSPQTTYTITAGNAGGSTQATVTITVNAASAGLSTFQAASVEIGQPDFMSSSGNQTPAANTLRYPVGSPVVGNGVLYISDNQNNRILGFNSVPTSNHASADFVLGQTSFAYNGSGSQADQLYNPETLRVSGGKLFAVDRGNARILIWNTLPTTTAAAADVVVGQSTFGISTTACTNSTLSHPDSVEVAGGKLIVTDTQNNRVLIWNTIPTTNGAAADVVLGQGDFTHCAVNDDAQTGNYSSASTARTVYEPQGVWSDGTRLIVSDTYNYRVLIWNTIPTTNFKPADLVLGQADFTHNMYNDDNQDGISDATPSARTVFNPTAVDSDGTQLFLVDIGNNRVLIWKTIPTASFTPADMVLGQGDFTHSTVNDDNQDGSQDANCSARTLYVPNGVYAYGGQLFVSDAWNSRVLIF